MGSTGKVTYVSSSCVANKLLRDLSFDVNECLRNSLMIVIEISLNSVGERSKASSSINCDFYSITLITHIKEILGASLRF